MHPRTVPVVVALAAAAIMAIASTASAATPLPGNKFQVNVQALTVFQARLLDVQPDGQQHLVAQDDQQFVTALNPAPVLFDLHAQGTVLHKGDTLKLEVFAQTANALVVLNYGGATPSGVK